MSVYPGDSGEPVAAIRFDNIGKAWKLTQERLGVWLPALLLMFAVTVAISSVFALLEYLAYGRIYSSTDSDKPAGVILLNVLSSLMGGAVGAYFLGGFYRMAFRQLRGEPITVSDAFSGADVALPLWGAGILTGIGVGIGAVFCLVPGLLLAGLWMFVQPLIVDKRMGIFEAMGVSFNTLRPHMWAALGYVLVMGLVSALGVLLCCVGVLFTAPIFYLGVALAYREFFPDADPGQRGPTLVMPLPPTA